MLASQACCQRSATLDERARAGCLNPNCGVRRVSFARARRPVLAPLSSPACLEGYKVMHLVIPYYFLSTMRGKFLYPTSSHEQWWRCCCSLECQCGQSSCYAMEYPAKGHEHQAEGIPSNIRL